MIPPEPIRIPTSAVLSFNVDTRCLQILAMSPPDRAYRTARRNNLFTFAPEITHCFALPLVPEGDDVDERQLGTLIPVPGQQDPSPFSDMSSRELRLFQQGAPELDRLHGTAL